MQEIRSRTKVPEDITFKIKIKSKGESFVTTDEESGYSLLRQIRIKCTDMVRSELQEKLQSEEDITGTFQHITDGELGLVAVE